MITTLEIRPICYLIGGLFESPLEKMIKVFWEYSNEKIGILNTDSLVANNH